MLQTQLGFQSCKGKILCGFFRCLGSLERYWPCAVFCDVVMGGEGTFHRTLWAVAFKLCESCFVASPAPSLPWHRATWMSTAEIPSVPSAYSLPDICPYLSSTSVPVTQLPFSYDRSYSTAFQDRSLTTINQRCLPFPLSWLWNTLKLFASHGGCGNGQSHLASLPPFNNVFTVSKF